MTNRRGIALLAALWFVVAIATVGLALGLESMEHRRIGLAATDQGIEAAAATGGLAIALGRLEQLYPWELRVLGEPPPTVDPWLEPNLLVPSSLRVGNVLVSMYAEDLQAKLNINSTSMPILRTFLGLVLQDYDAADALAQAIDDWRDRDDRRQPRGAERDDYLARRQLDLPTNRGFRDLEELRSVQGMTPAVFAVLRPYLRTHGEQAVNVNTAPAVVLRALPALTAAMVTRILSIRSRHQWVTSWEQVGMRDPFFQLEKSVTLWSRQLELTVTAALPPPARPMQQVWTIDRNEFVAVDWMNNGYVDN